MPWGAVAGAVIGAGGAMSSAHTQSQAASHASDIQQSMWQQTRADLQPWMQAGQLSLRDLMTRMGIRGTQGSPNSPSPGFAPGSPQGGYAGIMPGAMTGPPMPGMEGGDPNDPNFGQLTHQFNLQDFQESPAYQFNLQQGKMALDKASAARGKFYAPSTLQDIAKFSQGMASNEYQNAFSNYQTNMGNIWNRLNSLSSGGQNAAAQLGGFGTQVGGQLGANAIGAGNAQAAGQVGAANALTGGIQNYMNSQLWQQMLSGNQQGSTQYVEQDR